MRKNRFYAPLLSICCLLLTSFGLYAQPNDLPSVYTGVQETDMTIVYKAQFTDSPGQEWEDETIDYKMGVSKKGTGLVLRSNISSYCPVLIKENPLDKNKNFQIETEIKWQKVGGKIGLAFGGMDENNVYLFTIEQDRNFSISYMKNGVETKIKDRIACSNIKPNEYNLLTVRKSANEWYFFINKERVAQEKNYQIFGKEIGWILQERATLLAKALDVKYLRNDHEAPFVFIEIAGREGTTLLNNKDVISVSQRDIEVRFKVLDGYCVKEVKIDNMTERIIPKSTCIITRKFSIIGNDIPVLVDATDENENTNSLAFTLKYVPEHVTPAPVQATTVKPAPPQPVVKPISSKHQKNIVLFIGIDRYMAWLDLKNAKTDCRLLANTLVEKYDFDRNDMVFLFDERATRKQIINTLDSLKNVLRADDNFLIYYAGHGTYDSTMKVGYWVPSDAERNDISSYIPNSDVKNYIKGNRTQNTLLIADACFGGSIILREIESPIENAKSRWAFTSGSLEPVEDGIEGEGSPFARAVNQVLLSNKQEALPAHILFEQVKAQMLRIQSATTSRKVQTPLCNRISDAGDEGGVFVFRKKR